MSHRKSSSLARPKRTGLAGDVNSVGSRSRKWIVPGLILMGVLATGYWVFAPSRADLSRARALLDTDPAAAEQLAEQAVVNAGGNYPEAQLLQCRALAATGQWNAALGGMSLIQDTSQCDPEELLDLGRRAMNAGEWKLAEVSLQAASARASPALSPALDQLVRLQLRFQRLEEAMALCRDWQQRAPDAAVPWAIAGDLEMAAVNFGAAIADYRQALHRKPPADLEYDVRSSLAQILVLSGDATAARIEFDLLMQAKPLTGKLQLSYVQLLRLEGRFDEGLAEVDRYLQRSGSNSESLKLRGILQLDVGHAELAIGDLKQSVGLNPYDIGAEHKLAQAYLQAGDGDSARPHLERARKMTDATYRISDVQQRLQANPTDPGLQQELKDLKAILGQ